MEALHSQHNVLKIKERMEGMRGNVHLCIKRNGEIIREEDDHNLIVTGGRAKLARLMGGSYDGHISQVGVGEGVGEDGAAAAGTGQGSDDHYQA